MATGTLDTAAPGSRRTPLAVAFPVVVIATPLDATLPEKSTTPAMPDAGSMKPLSATSRCLIEIAPWNGVSATSFRLNGPASPSTEIVPPAGAFADTEKGNGE